MTQGVSAVATGGITFLPPNHMYLPVSHKNGGGEIIFCPHPEGDRNMTKAKALGDIFSNRDKTCRGCKKCKFGI